MAGHVVCFLTRKLSSTYAETVDLLAVACPSAAAYVLVDEDSEVQPKHAQKLVVSETECVGAGYTHLNYFKPVSAWEKCLYALQNVIPFEHVWIIEDDCCFASPSAFRALLEKYEDTPADLIATYFQPRSANERWPHWHYADAYFTGVERAKLSKSFNVLMRASKTLIGACDAAIRARGRATFLECFFINVCMQNSLSYVNADAQEPHVWYCPREGYLDTVDPSVFHPAKDEVANLRRLQRP
jgi:hypothetical protein